LGYNPKECLLLVPAEHQPCADRKKCSAHRPKDCLVRAKKRPWCFQPESLPSPAAGMLIQAWGEGLFVLVVVSDGTP
jgi:hypothetical protein